MVSNPQIPNMDLAFWGKAVLAKPLTIRDCQELSVNSQVRMVVGAVLVYIYLLAYLKE